MLATLKEQHLAKRAIVEPRMLMEHSNEQTSHRINHNQYFEKYYWLLGLVAWFSLLVREVPGSIPGAAPLHHETITAWKVSGEGFAAAATAGLGQHLMCWRQIKINKLSRENLAPSEARLHDGQCCRCLLFEAVEFAKEHLNCHLQSQDKMYQLPILMSSMRQRGDLNPCGQSPMDF